MTIQVQHTRFPWMSLPLIAATGVGWLQHAPHLAHGGLHAAVRAGCVASADSIARQHAGTAAGPD